MVEKCKIMDGRNPELEIFIPCLFNFKDQRFSGETGLGRGFLGSKLSGEILIHMTWIYLLVFSAELWMAKAFTASICICSWGRNPLKATTGFRAITSGTACPHLLCLLGSAGGECHTHFLYYTLSCLWPTLSENTLGERKSANIVFLLFLLCFSVWVWVYIEQRKKKRHNCFHI